MSQPDDACVLRFEHHRFDGGTDPIQQFLPPRESASYLGTLEELICIDLELRFKTDKPGTPSLFDYGPLQSDDVPDAVRDRLVRELMLLRTRFAAASDRSGSRIGPYELLEVAGRGAFATVWRARDPSLRRDVALKVPHGGLDDSASFARLKREAHSVAQLRHPGVVSVFEVGSDNGRPYIASDFVAGPSLREVMDEPRTFDQVARLLAELAAAVHYAHTCGVVHRDLKPSNVLLPSPNQPMLTDFGLAALDSAESNLTVEGDLIGTPSAMAPEQAKGDLRSIGATTDVYSLGVMLYELLAGKPAFAGESVAATLYAVVHHTPELPRRIRPDVPIDLETICLRAMAKSPGDRYLSAADLESDLRRFLARRPIEARRRGRFARMMLWTRRNSALATSLGAGLIAVLAVAAVGLSSVLHERSRFRSERDRARFNLYGSLVAEAELRVQTQASGWYQDAIKNIRHAVALDSPAFDELQLRNLVLRIHAERSLSFQAIATWPAPSDPATLLVAHVGNQLLVEVTRAGAVRVRDLGGNEIWTRAGNFTCAAWGTQGKKIYVGDREGVVLRLTSDGKDDIRWSGATDPIQGLIVSRTGSRLAVLSSGRQVDVLRITSRGLDLDQTLRGASGGTNCATFTHDESELFTGGEDGLIRRHSLTQPTEAVAFFDLRDPVRHMTPTLGRRHYFSACTDEMLGYATWDIRDGTISRAVTLHTRPVSGLHPFSGGLISTSLDGYVRARSVGGHRVAFVRTNMGRIVSSTLADDLLIAVHADGRTSTWRYARPPGTVILNDATCAAFATNDACTTIFTNRGAFTIRPGPHLKHLEDSEDARAKQQWAVAKCPTRDLVATAEHDGSVYLFDARAQLIRQVRDADDEIAWSLAFNPAGDTFAVGVGATIELHQTDDAGAPILLEGHDKLVVGLAYHPTRPMLVSTGLGATTRLWSTNDRRPLGQLDSGGRLLHALSFDPLRQRLAAAADDGSILIWTRVAPDSAPSHVLKVHDVAAWSVAFSPDGQLMASASQDGVVVLWRAETFEVIARIEGGSHLARQVIFGGGGRYLACACYTKAGLLWDLDAVRAVLRDIGVDWQDEPLAK